MGFCCHATFAFVPFSSHLFVAFADACMIFLREPSGLAYLRTMQARRWGHDCSSVELSARAERNYEWGKEPVRATSWDARRNV
jgi:hypothetical protein